MDPPSTLGPYDGRLSVARLTRTQHATKVASTPRYINIFELISTLNCNHFRRDGIRRIIANLQEYDYVTEELSEITGIRRSNSLAGNHELFSRIRQNHLMVIRGLEEMLRTRI